MNEKYTEMNSTMNELQNVIYGWIAIKKHSEDIENYLKLKAQYDAK
jgi:hypothetical protein